MHYESKARIFFTKHSILFVSLVYTLSLFVSVSCQKELKIKYGTGETKQVIIGNLYPDNILYVNISRSKQPNDYSSVEFLSNCKVDLYEDSIFKETMPFILKDTLSGLGSYVSSFHLKQNKTYKIVSTHPELGTAEATEFLPPMPRLIYVTMLQHADSSHPSAPGKYSVVFEDSADWKNYYYINAFYRILKPVINELGDTTYKYDFINNIPFFSPEIQNPSNYYRSFFTDAAFDGQIKSFTFDFTSQYNNLYKEITFFVELSNTGKNYYEWNIQQIPLGQDFLNEGQLDRANLKSNIKNGFGHFTANSSSYFGIKIK